MLTGKGLEYGGSLLRPEATGYGCVYFAQEMLATRGDSVRGKTALVSGSGNVAQYTVEKLNELGGKAITLSDSEGTIVDPNGINPEKLAWVMQLKNLRRGRIREYADQFKGVTYLPDQRPWGVPWTWPSPAPPRTKSMENARTLVENGCQLVAEGANMPTVPGGVDVFLEAKILYGPGKAANAGGVATSGLEMTQNAGVTRWTRDEVDQKLRQIMHEIHANCVSMATKARSPTTSAARIPLALSRWPRRWWPRAWSRSGFGAACVL